MSNRTELMRFAKFLNIFREGLQTKGALNFIDSNMCVLNETYYIKITDEGISIKNNEEELEFSRDFYFYETLESIFEDAYQQRNSKKKKVVKRLDFLLKRVMKKYNKSSNKPEERLDLEDFG